MFLSLKHKFALWGIVALLAVTASASPLSNAQQLKIKKTLKKVSSKTTTSLTVLDLNDGTICFERNSDMPLKPASVMKLLTTAAAVEQFGIGHTFDTTVMLSNKELWIIGGGDPGLGDQRIDEKHGKRWLFVLDELVNKLQSEGITTLENIVLDVSAFDEQTRHPDWDQQQFHTWFFAPVGGLNLADNCVEVSVTVTNNALQVAMMPALPASFVESTLKIGDKNKPILRRHPKRDYFEVSGSVKSSCDIGIASVNKPTQFFGHAVKEHLEKRGITVTGNVLQQRITPTMKSKAKLIATHSTSLEDVLWRSNTFSQNFFAECLTKSLGRIGNDGKISDTPGSWENGTARIRTILETLGVSMNGAVLRDGSGLSHKNRITTRQIVGVLKAMHSHKSASAFQESLARPGESGTMRRYRKSALKTRFMGKTGTLRNARALAGYITASDGRQLAFAVIANGVSPADFTRKIAAILAE